MMSAIETGPTFARQRDVFLQALEQPDEDARSAFLARATEGDPRLRAIVEKLLAEHRADNFLEEPPANLRDARDGLGGEQPGQMIGRYKLIEVIGEGGCGTVFLAEQREPVRRRVALKLIKLGMDTRSVVARFEAERQALALMDHPSIARVLDGGATSTGRPYFVMELVRGVRITEYCEANELDVRQRIELFIQLCFAIQHAHQKGIIHRDLKPSNVLVTMQDGTPVPKVIDFGIAKAIEEPLTDKTLFTNFHAFIGTPAYTSPEQAQMTGADVDTRSDIYSLGVLLYELLAGVTPFDPKELTHSGLDEMRRIIREQEPPRPSVRRTTLEARVLKAEGPQKTLKIDPDLDWIIMKSLEKDRAQRYPTAQELATDLQRYLDHEPVRARPPSRAYLIKKSLRKHRRSVAVAAMIALTLLVGATLSIWQAIRATRAEHAAERLQWHEASLRQKAEREREHALANQKRAELNEYIADINLAHQALLAGNFSRGADLLRKHLVPGKEDLRGFEWRYLWNLAKGDEHQVFSKESSSVFGLAASDDGRLLAVGLRDGIKIYDLKSGHGVKTIPKSGISLAFSRDGLLGSASPGNVHVWNARDWSEVLTLEDHSGPVTFSADGTLIASATRLGVAIENIAEKKQIAFLKEVIPPIALSPTTNHLVANSRDGLNLFQIHSGEKIAELENSSALFNSRWILNKPVLRFSPDGRWIVAARTPFRSSEFRIELWNAETGEHIAEFPTDREAPEHVGVISGISFSPDGTRLATASWDHSVRLWDLQKRRCISKFQGTLSEVWAVTFAPDGRHIISGAKDGTVTLWPTDEERKSTIVEGSWLPLGFSSDSRLLAMLGADQTLAFFNLKTHEIEHKVGLGSSLERLRNPFLRPEINHDLSRVAIPSGGGSIRVFDLGQAEPVELALPAKIGRIDSFALSPDGASIITSTWGEGLSWWKLGEGSEEPRLISGERAVFATNGKVLVTIDSDGFGVWDALSGSALTHFSTGAAFSAALSPDGLVLAAGSDPQEVENAIRLWDTRTGRLLGICAGHTQGVGRLVFSSDGKTLASTSSDGTLRFWNVKTQQQLLALSNVAPFSDFQFSPDGSVLIARAQNGLVAFDAPHDDK